MIFVKNKILSKKINNNFCKHQIVNNTPKKIKNF